MRLPATVRRLDISGINLYDPAWYATGDPHSAWYTLRAECPVYWQEMPDGSGFWLVTRHHDVCEVLRNFGTFTSRRGNLLTTLSRHDLASDKMLAVTDPPLHTVIKRQLNRYFTRAAVQALEPDIRAVARRVIAAGIDGNVFDLAAHTAMYPIAVTALLMGLDERDWARLRRFSYIAIADQDTDITMGEDSNALARAHAEIFAYFAGHVRPSGSGADNVITAIRNAHIGDRPLSRTEVLFNCYSLLLGATVTTAHAVNVAVLALDEFPDQAREWRHTGSTEFLGEEVLRWSSPANHFLRYATHDTDIAGTVIRKDDPVTVWLGSANRDERVFENPYQFKVNRNPGQHIAFGVGAHRCIGAPLARLALTVFLDEARDLVEEFNVAGPVAHLSSNFIAGVKQLPASIVLKPGAHRALADVTPLDCAAEVPAAAAMNDREGQAR